MPNITKYKTETRLISGLDVSFQKELQKAIDDGFIYMNDLSTATAGDTNIVYSTILTKTTIVDEG